MGPFYSYYDLTLTIRGAIAGTIPNYQVTYYIRIFFHQQPDIENQQNIVST